MMRKFNYDVVQLIDYVKDRPCLWDKRIESYKDRVERRIAWEEIFVLLDPSYNDMTAEEQRLTGEGIINKWTNIRDSFVKTLKPHLGKPKKKYLYHQELKFLMEVHPPEEYNVVDYYVSDVDTSHVNYIKQERIKRKRLRKNYDEDKERKSKKMENSDQEYMEGASENDNIDFVGLNDEESSSEIKSRLMNEDEAFFASLLPTVVKYNEDERLEFRIDVLNIMRKIKEKRISF